MAHFVKLMRCGIIIVTIFTN